MSDLIDRQRVLNILSYFDLETPTWQLEMIKKLPSAEPEQKTGKWEWVQYDSNHEIGDWHCSECGFMPASFNLAKKHLNYCPNCGARMVGEEE